MIRMQKILPHLTTHPLSVATGLGITLPTLPTWVAPTVYNYTNTVELDGQ